VAGLLVQVLPDLTVSVTPLRPAGVAPYAAVLTAQAIGGEGPYLDTWNFGDGTPVAYGVIVPHTFANAGTFAVTLHTVDSLGDVATASVPVLVVNPLSVKIGGAPPTVEAATPVALSVTSLLGGDAPYTYLWSFGDGTSAVGGSATNHTYPRAGIFLAKLTVTDSVGESASSSTTVTVLSALTIAIGTGFGTVAAGFPSNLTVTVGGGSEPYAIRWSGLPAPCSSVNASALLCTPSIVGTYVVTVTVTDALGYAAATKANLTVVPPTMPGGPSAAPFSLLTVLAIGVAALLVVVIAVAVLLRRRGPPPPPDPPTGFESSVGDPPSSPLFGPDDAGPPRS
jgi:PKD repeat protein